MNKEFNNNLKSSIYDIFEQDITDNHNNAVPDKLVQDVVGLTIEMLSEISSGEIDGADVGYEIKFNN